MSAMYQRTISVKANFARVAGEVKRSGRSHNRVLMRGGKV